MILEVNVGALNDGLRSPSAALPGRGDVRPTLFVATVGALVGVLWLRPSSVPGLREMPEETA